MSNVIIKRPKEIFELFSSLGNLSGVGEKKLNLFEKKIGPYLINLLFYLPHKSINRFQNISLKKVNHGDILTCEVEVVEINIPPFNFRKKNNMSRIITFGLNNEKNVRLDIVYFGQNTQYLKNIYKVGNRVFVSGKFENFNGLGQIAHPDYVVKENEKKLIPFFQPIYPLFFGINQKFISKIINQGIKKIPTIPEWLDKDILIKYKFPNWHTCISRIHNPENNDDLNSNSIFKKRLALDELIANQISMLLIKNKISKIKEIKEIYSNSELIENFYSNLPFELTGNQIKVINEIKEDIDSSKTMVRMLQGDVGSGKTIVAVISMLNSILDGSQAVLMVPTEILAIQHFNTIKDLLIPLKIEPTLLLGESRSVYDNKTRSNIIKQIQDGKIKIIIGTHALISKKVIYNNLSLAVIDEQHRFGVKQRVEITEKGNNVNVLVMTATPIPRSLALTAYGDMDISVLSEKPIGRKSINTYVLSQTKIAEVLSSIERAINAGALVYWVCPLIEDSENSDLIAVNERYNFLKNNFKNINVSLIHGKQNQIERETSMNEFKSGESKILVATTVIEVGVDVPEATIMVIECAERFGLAQIHQLRGRVGRSNRESSCILLYNSNLSSIAHSRLKILKENDDGFKISEHDLELRGPGEILGSKQSGNLEFKFVDLHIHNHMIPVARDEARKMLENEDDKEKINFLLSIFENNEAIRLLKGG